MKPFNHKNAKSILDAQSVLAAGNAALIAGGTDLLGTLKDDILPGYPNTVVNLKSVPDLDFIREDDNTLRIGALTRLADIADNPLISSKYSALALAARSVATPHIRDMATIAGNISQLPRCWYFRKPDNRFPCLRKGGSECFAATGDHRYHSAFGGAKVAPSPCTQNCPAGINIPAYMAKIRENDWDAAANIIMAANPMPFITSRVCAHFCQEACNRCHSDEALLIGAGVERALGDYILDNSDKFFAPPSTDTHKSVAVVGAGPSGLAAAYFLRRAGNKVTVYDSKPEAGGMLMYAIPAYRLPKDIVRRFIKILENMGISFVLNTKVGDDITPDSLESQFDSIYYATGAWKRPVVGIAGEELTVFGLDFLVEVKNWMEGKIGSDVVVTGGGNVAMDVAITAKRLGAKNVTLACLEPRERMPASSEEIARAIEEGITIMPSWGLSKVVEDNGSVKGMELKRCISPWDDTGAFNPQYDESETTVVSAQNILMAVGQRVDLSFLSDKYQLQLTQRGLIDVSESAMTSKEGVFAGGDVTTGPATVVSGIANGRKAASGINSFLDVLPPLLVDSADPHAFLSFDPEGIQRKDALKLRELDAEKRSLDQEDSSSPDVNEALAEAQRCLNCGCYAVNPSDVAPALIALDASIVTNSRSIPAAEFFDVKIPNSTVLNCDEIITEIHIPVPAQGAKSTFVKMAFRKSIDFPMVNCAILLGPDPRICLNAVAPVPIRALNAEKLLAGNPITDELAEKAGAAAVADAQPFEESKFKVQIAKTIVKRALLSLK